MESGRWERLMSIGFVLVDLTSSFTPIKINPALCLFTHYPLKCESLKGTRATYFNYIKDG